LRAEKTIEGFLLEVHQFMQFGQLTFGWQSSPYFALWMHARCIKLVKQVSKDPTSAFFCEHVVLNLLGLGWMAIPFLVMGPSHTTQQAHGSRCAGGAFQSKVGLFFIHVTSDLPLPSIMGRK